MVIYALENVKRKLQFDQVVVRGDGRSDPSRVLLVMDPKAVVHGVGVSGSIMLTSDGEGMSAVMMSSGQRESGTATPNPKTSGQSPTSPRAFD
ncbi:hypothetical protein LBMAG15_11350 [Actinomycetes bacterium]|nr:hypothetical protein LBMAG15_11350 [Actinomycetes bacterium]